MAGQSQYGVATGNTQGTGTFTQTTCGTSAPTYTYGGGCSLPPASPTTNGGTPTAFPVNNINAHGFPTLYVYGDVPMFYQTLNAVAMVFNSSLFTGGGSLMLLGGLITLMLLGFRAINHQPGGIRVQAFFLILLFYWTGISVQTTVYIEDIFTGNVTAVSNIPVFIGFPAGVFSATSFSLTQTMETAFQTPSASGGNFIALQNGGFTNPLKLLMSLRCTAHNNCIRNTFPLIAESVRNFELYCAIGNPSFNYQSLITAPNAITYMTTLPNLLGLTTYYNTAVPKGINVACGDAANSINQWVGNMMNAGTPENLVLTNMIKSNMINDQTMIGPVGTATPQNTSQIGLTALSNAYISLINGSNAQSAAQSSQDYMINMMFGDIVNDTFKCSANSGSTASFVNCTEAISQRQALEQMKVDNAGAASLFERAMFPTMNLLLMLFFGMAPLVAMVVVMSPETTLKVLGSYVLFGVWTQSWMPIAAVINYYVQLLAQQVTAVMTSSYALSITNMFQFTDAIGLKIGLASQMLAATPMITMAVLSGSVFAVTNVVSGIGGKDHFDESLAAPSLANGNAVTQVGAGTSYSAARSGYANKPGLQQEGGQSGPVYSLGEGLKHSSSEALSEKTSAIQNWAKTVNSIAGIGGSQETTLSKGEKFTAADSKSDADMASLAWQKAETTGQQRGYNKEQIATLATQNYIDLKGGVNGKLGGSGGGGSDQSGGNRPGTSSGPNVDGSVNVGVGAGGKASQDASLKATHTEGTTLNNNQTDSDSTSNNKATTKGVSADINDGLTNVFHGQITKQQALALAAAYTRVQSAEQAYNESVANEQSAGTNASFDGVQGTRFMLDHHDFSADTNARYQEASAGDDGAFIRQREAFFENSINVSNMSNPQDRLAAVTWAQHLALASSGNSAYSGEAAQRMAAALGGYGTDPTNLADDRNVNQRVDASQATKFRVNSGISNVENSTSAAQQLRTGLEAMSHLDSQGRKILNRDEHNNYLHIPLPGEVAGANHDPNLDHGIGGPDGTKNIQRYNAFVDQLSALPYHMTGSMALDALNKAGYAPNVSTELLGALVNKGNGGEADRTRENILQQEFDKNSVLGVLLDGIKNRFTH